MMMAISDGVMKHKLSAHMWHTGTQWCCLETWNLGSRRFKKILGNWWLCYLFVTCNIPRLILASSL